MFFLTAEKLGISHCRYLHRNKFDVLQLHKETSDFDSKYMRMTATIINSSEMQLRSYGKLYFGFYFYQSENFHFGGFRRNIFQAHVKWTETFRNRCFLC